MEITKQNGNVAFAENEHVYWNVKDASKKYISVTTLIGKFEQPYDKEFWSKYKALERILGTQKFSLEKSRLLTTKKWNNELLEIYDISELEFNKVQQNILDEWAEKNRNSCERGTKIHLMMENKFYSGAKSYSLTKFGIGGKFQCIKDKTELDLERGIYPEYLISYEDDEINIAGQIDLLILNGNNLIIGDYKTNEKIDFKSYYDSATKKNTMMKYPLNNLYDCNFYHYSLQLSTYAWMIKKKLPHLNVERLFIVHFDHNNNVNIHEINYLESEVERMIKHYKKMIKLEEKENKRKPIIF